ncbi:hypothetical protein PIB30_078598, partial [Stylosanthes scabra]|nr:hypothetical protein [Stylosanthes scabra]
MQGPPKEELQFREYRELPQLAPSFFMLKWFRAHLNGRVEKLKSYLIARAHFVYINSARFPMAASPNPTFSTLTFILYPQATSSTAASHHPQLLSLASHLPWEWARSVDPSGRKAKGKSPALQFSHRTEIISPSLVMAIHFLLRPKRVPILIVLNPLTTMLVLLGMLRVMILVVPAVAGGYRGNDRDGEERK